MSIILVIVILVLLIVTHEFGHFVAAKLSGVRVDEFGVGYPPRAFLFGILGGTEYTLNWIPFGGFVRLFGDEHDDNQRGAGAFVKASYWKQLIILAAGVCMNLLIGWGLFAYAFHLGVPRVVSQPEQGAQLLITEVISGSPAEAAGLRAGDQLLSLTDVHGTTLGIASSSAIEDFVAERGGQQIAVTYVRAGATSTTTVIPANAVIPGEAARPALGVGFALVTNTPESWPLAVTSAFWATYDTLIRTVQALWSIVVGAVHGAPDLSQIVGPVGLVSVVTEASQAGWAQVVALAAFISVNLVVVNLLPIPALDGGRLLVTAVEWISRRRVPQLAVHLLNAVGITLIAVLMIVVTYHDIARLVT